jgi:O-antigen/teichoic acid export membrane protein
MAPIILIVAFAQVFVLLILNVNRKDMNLVLLSVIGMTISLFINTIFIPHFAEIATGLSLLVAEFFVTLVSYFLAKKVLDFNFPTKTFFINLVLVIPFSIITYLSFKFLHNNFLIILISSIFCGLYFLFYQLFLIKDKFIIEIEESILRKIKNKFN